MLSVAAPQIDAVRALAARLQRWLVRTPVIRCRPLEAMLGGEVEIHAKLEFLQHTGTFKPRGALSVLLGLDRAQLDAGITAVSAGNHAIAAAFAAQTIGSSAKVVMIRSASPVRIERCRDLGAEVVLADDAHQAFEMAEEIGRREGRYFVHPFEGPAVALGTATVGLEICEQIADFDAVVIPIGGGGLCAGISSAVKQLKPKTWVVGVEPTGADSMHRSFAKGRPEAIDAVRTIADSLGAPFALPYSYAVCRDNVDELTLVDDAQLRVAMGVLFREMKIAVEPACAASTAALLGPLRERLAGKKLVLVFCGSNIDWETYARDAVLSPPDVD
jgi:threonine dehydratase